MIRRVLAVGIVVLGVLVLALAVPVIWVETSCRGEARSQTEPRIVTEPEHRRPEARTLLTYPEWHIVYAYEDLAATLAEGDPHRFAYGPAVAGFWSALCAVTREASAYGPAGLDAKATIYTIGTSFTLEMAAKAAYEETLGRLAALTRPGRATPQDAVEAEMAAIYGAFLHQTPWYRFDFPDWADRLWAAPLPDWGHGRLRGVERRLAVGAEWWAKSLYARLLGAAAGAMGGDEARMRVHLTGLSKDALAALPDIVLVAEAGDGVVLDVPRYRAFTGLLASIAGAGGRVTEIAGNDDILLTVLASGSGVPGAVPGARVLARIERPGFAEDRLLVMAEVGRLTEVIRALDAEGLRLEHVYDY